MDAITPPKEVETSAQSDNLIGMKMTLTDFQRDFRKAREAADRGHTIVVADNGGVEYLFERHLPQHPFEGLDDVFGSIALPRDGLTLKERIRQRIDAKYRHR